MFPLTQQALLLLSKRSKKPGYFLHPSCRDSSSSLCSFSDVAVSTTTSLRRVPPSRQTPSSPSSTSSKSTFIRSRMYNSLNCQTPFQLCFLRHGQSTWNRDNRFIGWMDTPLTDDGVLEARVAGQMLHKSGILFDEVHTSMLRRSIRTVNLVLMELGQEYIPVHKHWRLNERSYGNLVGLNKKETVKLYGKDQVKRWRRSYDEPPPPMTDDHPYHPARDPRYRLMLDQIPKCESLHDTMMRSSVYWDEVIAPALRAGKTLLIVGHENNLRSLIMRLEDISKDDIINLDLPRAVPLAYRLHPHTLKPLDRPDGKLDEATGFLRGHWLGGDKAVAEILQRDHHQVYNTNVTQNLEVGPSREHWKRWMELAVGPASPEARAKAEENHHQQQQNHHHHTTTTAEQQYDNDKISHNNNNINGGNDNNSHNDQLEDESNFKRAASQ